MVRLVYRARKQRVTVRINVLVFAWFVAWCTPALGAEQNRKAELAERRAFIQKAMDDQMKRIQAEEAARNRRGEFSSLSVATLVPFGDWDAYYLKDGSIRWTPNAGQNFQPVVVPVGFVTDLASIPRAFWSALRPEGRYAYAAVVHDYLYWTQTRDREEADRILKIAMEDSKVKWAIMEPVYEAVRLLGERAWKNNARLKKAGEHRILKRFPTDFTVNWSDWKKQPNVFADK
jgi:uncharacterized protein DUF1353